MLGVLPDIVNSNEHAHFNQRLVLDLVWVFFTNRHHQYLVFRRVRCALPSSLFASRREIVATETVHRPPFPFSLPMCTCICETAVQL